MKMKMKMKTERKPKRAQNPNESLVQIQDKPEESKAKGALGDIALNILKDLGLIVVRAGDEILPDDADEKGVSQVCEPGRIAVAREAYRLLTGRGYQVWYNSYLDDEVELDEEAVALMANLDMDALDAHVCGVTIQELAAYLEWKDEQDSRCTAVEDGVRCSATVDWVNPAYFERGVTTLCEEHRHKEEPSRLE